MLRVRSLRLHAFTLALAALALLLAPAAGRAGDRSYRSLGHKDGVLRFHVAGVRPADVHRAQVKVGSDRRLVPLRSLRRALARGASVRALAPKTTGGTPRLGHGRLLLKVADPKPAPCPEKFGSFGASALPGGCWRPYGAASPFNQRIPASPRVSANSARMTSTVTGWGAPEDLVTGVAGTGSDWMHPVYYARASDPMFTVHCERSWGTCEIEGLPVRIPDAAKPAAGGDGHMSVVDQANGWEYDFWQVSSKPSGGGRISIAWGGRTKIGTADSDGLGSDATGSHFGLLAGIIRAPEMEAGVINHALFMVIKCDNGAHAYPALAEGSKCSDGSISAPEGARFQLDMTDAQIRRLDVPAWKKTILTAMARYGMYVGDTGSQSWGVAIESDASYTSLGQSPRWTNFVKKQSDRGSWGGRPTLSLGAGVDWAKYLRVLDPCVAQRSC